MRVYSWPKLKHQATFRAAAVNLHDIAFSPSGTGWRRWRHPHEDGSVEIFSGPGPGKSLKVLGGQGNLVMGCLAQDSSRARGEPGPQRDVVESQDRSTQRRFEGIPGGSVRCAFCRRRKSLSARVWTGA
ncbi:MAG: hypothetical protein CM1200mP2_31230 [Planctomycetaceae bacterium]|nr:MAG: hypothetical protein CM1200mP2_31230 [Planctomycetaceae bacterium]